ncbi:MAG: hypothetical protein ABIG93_04925 [archaeon]|nr:hypothetical protein [Nanoarchaeota archaeon]
MALDKKECAVLKVLVEKELENIQTDSSQLMVSNSPFFNKVALDDSDIAFMKSEKDYEEFLKQLLKKI